MSTEDKKTGGLTRSITHIPGAVSRWMDGSLFFSAVTWVMDFLRRLCAGSFLVGLISADYDESRLQNSFFVRLAERVLNGCPKWITAPAYWPKRLSDACAGSWLVKTMCNALDTPIPPGLSGATQGFLIGVLSVVQWLAASAPVWGLLLAVVGAPFLPTMLLAGVLVVAGVLALFRYRFIMDLPAVCWLLFILITLFYGVTSFHPSSSIPIALLTSVLMFSYLLITACCRKRAQLDFFFFGFITASAFTGLVGLYQFLTNKQDTTWVDTELFSDIGFRVYATFGNPNVYGTYLLLAIPLCAALVLYVKKPLYKLYALGITGLLLINLLLSYSRGCYLALALAALIFVLLTAKRLVVFFSAGLVLLPFVLPASILNRLLSITNFADSSTSYRLFIWQGTLRVLHDFWMVGVGQGLDAYNVVFPFYAFNAIVAPHSHNLYLQVFVETGIVGLLIFLVALACFYREMVRFLRRTADKRNKYIAAAMIAAVTAFLFQGIFDYVFYNYKVMLTFFIFMGLGCAFTRLSDRESA